MTTLDESARPTAAGRPAGWYDDPQKLHDQRFYNGREWTAHVTHFGPKPCRGCSR